MVNYKIEVVASAEKALKRLPKPILPKIIQAIQQLAINPRPSGCRKLSGHDNTFRIRIQTHRIIYDIYDDLVLIKILKIGHRKDVYRT